MKNTNMIRFTRGAVLAGLVLGSSMANAWGVRTVVAPKAATSFFSNHKLALGLGTAGVLLTAGVVASVIDFVKSDAYKKNTDGKWAGFKNYWTHVGGRLSDGGSYSWNKAKDATFATGRGIKDATYWTGRTAKTGARKTVKFVSFGKWCNDDAPAQVAPVAPKVA